MKKIWTLWMASLFVVLASAQEADWMTRMNELQKEINTYIKEEKWGKAADYMNKQLKLFMSQPDSVRIATVGDTDMNSNFYYNLSCFYALDGKKKQAINAFKRYTERSVGLSEINLNHISTDSDLNSIRNNKEFEKCMEKLNVWGDYLNILKEAAPYENNQTSDVSPFQYAHPNDSNLVRVRQYFNLDSIAGAGNELTKIKNLLTFVHNAIRHDGAHGNPKKMNAIDMYEACKDGSRGLNCRGLAIVLNECYLAMGFKSRFVTCMPRTFISDCHVINAVYSNTLDKWLYVDPTQNAMVFDENNLPLSVQEVRERLRDGRPLALNEDANWNNQNKTTVEDYLYRYMAKNLYAISCTDRSEYNLETRYKGKKPVKYHLLCPTGFTPENYGRVNYIITTDDAWFWQSPYTK